jgi:hypothetical protein
LTQSCVLPVQEPTKDVAEILTRNRVKLTQFLTGFQSEKQAEDELFRDELQMVITRPYHLHQGAAISLI